METLQHFLVFLIQFVFVSRITVITISFVNYIIPSEQFQLSESLPDLTITENNLALERAIAILNE